MTLIEHYRRLRAPRFSPYNPRQVYVMSARSALQGARCSMQADAMRDKWRAMGGNIIASNECDDAPGTVRIVEYPDESCSFDDLAGDTFNPIANPDIKPHILEREERAEIERIKRDGIWGYVAQFWDGAAWQDTDSIWGFVGDDFDDSGCDIDLMGSAMDAYEATLGEDARDLEAQRPDLYHAVA